MKFEVPQFINVEDKLFGPFTFRQSIYLVGGGGIVFLMYRLLPLFIVGVIGIPVVAFTIALVFYKPNGRPFIQMVEAYVLYLFTHKFYLWKKTDNATPYVVEEVHSRFPKKGEVPAVDRQKISDLAWNLDILDFDQ